MGAKKGGESGKSNDIENLAFDPPKVWGERYKAANDAFERNFAVDGWFKGHC